MNLDCVDPRRLGHCMRSDIDCKSELFSLISV
jgi:hypothetical protein